MTTKDMYNPKKLNRNHTRIFREEVDDGIMK